MLFLNSVTDLAPSFKQEQRLGGTADLSGPAERGVLPSPVNTHAYARHAVLVQPVDGEMPYVKKRPAMNDLPLFRERARCGIHRNQCAEKADMPQVVPIVPRAWVTSCPEPEPR